MYIKVNGDIIVEYSINQLILDNPNVSFPSDITEEILNHFSVYPYIQLERPVIDEKTQKLELGSFYYSAEHNSWVRDWNILQKSPEEINEWLAQKATEVRSKRNSLLEETDFYGLSDVTMPDNIRQYRQALRDVTSQPGFPENVVWPIKE